MLLKTGFFIFKGMYRFILNLALPILTALLVATCGIKKDPEPLPKPKYKVLRVGSTVFLIPRNGDIYVEGFHKRDGFFEKLDPKAFCFRVKHRAGAEELVCVDKATSHVPKIELRDEGDAVVLSFGRKGTYRVRPYRDGIVPRLIYEVRNSQLKLKKRYEPYKVAITEVIGRVESEPVVVEVPAKEPPVPPKPVDLKVVVKGGKLYLFWWSNSEDIVGFLVFKNGKQITPKPIVQNYFVDTLPDERTLYEVVSVNRFGVRSEPASTFYSP
jgi:hypothetical protein